MNKYDKDILELQRRKSMLDALDRLQHNADFKKVIFEGYLREHPLELLKAKGVLKLDQEINQDINKQLDSVAMFGMYLENCLREIPDIDLRIQESEDARNNYLKGNENVI